VRLFVALDLPAEARAALAALRHRLEPDTWRPVADEALHVTLAFLGSRPESDIDIVGALLAPGPAPALGLGELALLPPRRPRVAAVDLQDRDGTLRTLQADLSEALAAAGVYTPEKRPFRPHTTVARLRAGARPPRDAPEIVPEPLAFHGEAVTLYRSRLHPRGARYEPLTRAELS
jgi:RNA 2',3'-cyclic 3'-phosphodiesterase